MSRLKLSVRRERERQLSSTLINPHQLFQPYQISSTLINFYQLSPTLNFLQLRSTLINLHLPSPNQLSHQPASPLPDYQSIVFRHVNASHAWSVNRTFKNKRTKFSKDQFRTPTWPPFHCSGTPTWPPWRHVQTPYCHEPLPINYHKSTPTILNRHRLLWTL